MMNPATNNIIQPDQQTIMNDIATLIEHEIPECQQNLKDNHKNLERVAEYCDTNYFRSDDRVAATDETKNYATQSLASVAYQITSLAFNILHLIDLQTTQITGLVSQASHLTQADQIHREKVARREIGLFTANKRPGRIPKIIYPTNPERPTKYVRKPIDYSLLDDVGHGVKLPPSQPASQPFERQDTEPDWAPKNYIEKVIALYDYTKEKPDELNLCENAIIYVTKKNEDGWYEGVLDGEEGLFPCNYVEPLRDY